MKVLYFVQMITTRRQTRAKHDSFYSYMCVVSAQMIHRTVVGQLSIAMQSHTISI
jgi:hypothetical protein